MLLDRYAARFGGVVERSAGWYPGSSPASGRCQPGVFLGQDPERIHQLFHAFVGLETAKKAVDKGLLRYPQLASCLLACYVGRVDADEGAVGDLEGGRSALLWRLPRPHNGQSPQWRGNRSTVKTGDRSLDGWVMGVQVVSRPDDFLA